VTLGASNDRNQMFISGVILLLAGCCPTCTRGARALVESLTTRRARDELSHELATSATRLQEANEALAEEMIERLKAAAGELVAAQKLRMHFERTPLAVIEWDRKQRITAWNPAAEAIFGFAAVEAVGKRLPSCSARRRERRPSRRCATSCWNRATATSPRS
jgi:PAS domain-containing protein